MPDPRPTACLALADGTVFFGRGFGAAGLATAELVFNTAMTGYQEIMTDPSFAGQVITFTFPHIGNVGANPDDIEADAPHALGMIVREDPTAPSNFRAMENLAGWMARHNRIGLAGIDTRALTRRIRAAGALILGTLNMHEAALGATTDNRWYGRTHNPHRHGHTPGGSSGGSGAAVAAVHATRRLS